MKIKRILFILIFIAFFILTLSGNKSKAKTMDTPIYLGTQEFRTDSDPANMGYAINDPDTNGSTSGGNIKGAKLWKIVKYSSPSATTYDNSIDYYCIRAGIGFRNTDGKVLYNVSYDFKKDRSQLQSSTNNILKILSSDNVYYKLLAMSDLMYIKGESTTQERTELIEKACSSVGVDVEDFAVEVTDSDIEAVQQAALWYFTNQDETENFSQIYDQLGMENQQWLRYKIKGESSYRPLSDYDGSGLEGEQRQIQAIAIYNYLINTTKKNEQSYKNGTARSRSIITLYANATDFNEQPVIVIEKEPAEFDLALRKYITKVNGTNVNISRNPVIDKSTLNTGTTATYKHKKDPVKVKYGDTVTYNLTIYNEGEIDGRASKIIDQLPTGLKFSKVNTSGYTSQYDEETNQVTLIKNTENNLKAYDGENLSSETIEIECTVETVKGEILTNVAWISEEIDVNGTVITTEKGKDRDSEPGTKPNVNKDNMTDYKGNTSNKTDLTNTNYFYKGEQDDDDFEKLITEAITGNYQVQLEKVDKDTIAKKLQGAEFEVTLPGKTKETKTTNENGIIDLGTVEITEIANKDTITIKETKAPEGYNKILDTLEIEVEKQLVNGSYSAKNVTIKSGQVEGTEVKLEGNTIKITIGNVQKEFDLALRKYITKVNGTNVNISRNPVIDKSTLNTGTTATYKHKKDPVKVKYGDTVTYNLTIYNEGEIDGRASKIIDQLPTGLKFSKVNTSGYTSQYDEETNQVTLIKNTENNLKAYDGENLSSETIEIECTVETVKGEILTNVAWISEEIDVNGTVITTEKGKDRDSEPGTKPNVNKDNMTDYKGNTSNKTDLTNTNYFYKGEQDDDDFEKLITEAITGNYQVQLEKVDKDTIAKKLQGAEFEVTLPGKTKETKTTNENGIIDLGTVEITEIANKDTITIKETKAPEGYNKILDTLEIEVEKQLVNGSYSAKNVTTKSGQVEGTEVKLEGNTIKIIVADKIITGNYQVQLEKVDLDNKEIKLQGAEFEVTLPEKQKETKTTNENGIIDLGTIEITEIANKDTITVKETKAPEGYNKILDTLEIEVEKQLLNGSYSVKNAVLKSGQEEGTNIALEGNVIKITVANKLITGNYQIQLEKVDSDNPETKLQGAEFEITVPGKAVETKTTNENGIIELETVAITDITKKDTITVKETKAPKGYNHILDTLTIEVEKQIENDAYKIKEAKIISGQVEGTSVQINGNTIKIIVANKKITGNYQVQLEKVDKDNTTKKLQGAEFEITVPGKTTETKTTNENGIIDLGTIEITEIGNKDIITVKETKAPKGYNELIESLTIEVTKGETNGRYVATGATITVGKVQGAKVELNGNVITITVPNEKQIFDLALRKFIIAVSGDDTIENEDYLRNEDGSYTREPEVDTRFFNTSVSGVSTDEDGNIIDMGRRDITTADYNHTKEPVTVKVNDYVVYMIRVYNEGEANGYAAEIQDHLPPYLNFVENEFNAQYGWSVSENGRTVTTRYLENHLINAAEFNNDEWLLSYVEVPIMCRVSSSANANENITNIADITEYQDENREPAEDRDSEENNVDIPDDEDLPGYKNDEIDKDYVPGQQDDDDFEKVIVKEFDLALRKFITKVDEKEVTTRIPEVSYNEEKEQIEYNHTKEPVEVITDNIVTYTIRIFNEGDLSGYAKEVADDIPDGLEFLPDNEINQEYRWVMYDAEGNVTQNVEEAEKIVTDYLSKEQGEARMEEDSTLEENPNLLQAFNPEEEISETNPDYRDVKVAFRVVEPNTSDKILVNSAQIQEDENENGEPVDDIDSTPGEWNEGEDDQDKEYVKLTYFDLSLRKWVTQAIVIENGKETITQTGHTAEMDPEPVVKVELHRKKLDQVTVKFRYSIRITNEGEIAGYAKEITDYVPEGLKFTAEDNPGWTDEGNNVISTRLLENTLLQPGESAEVEVLLTWINGANNLGLKTNTAEISEDYNDKGAPDIDSTPDNKVPGEDDIDDAEVILSISTGQARIYYTLGFIVLITIGGGIFLIKRYVI